MIVVDAASLHRSRVGSITGKIHLQLGFESFPETGWSDFPVVILGWWIRVVLGLMRGESASDDLQFMDGPVVVHLRSDGDAQLKYRAVVQTQRGPEVVLSGRLDARHLLVGARDAARVLLDECRQRGWEGPDTVELEAAMTEAAGELDRSE